MATYHYGGQALIEGVLMRGRNALAIALRHPDGSIVWATERLDLGLRARRALKLPFLRGLVVLYDTLVTGTRWLVRSATVQALALESEEGEPGAGSGGVSGVAGGLLQTIAMLFTGPALCAAAGGDAPAGGASGAARKKEPGTEPAAAKPGRAAAAATPVPADSATAENPVRKGTPRVSSGEAVVAPAIAAEASSYSDPDTSSTSTATAEQGMGKGYTVAVGGMLVISLGVGIVVFFLLPLFLAQATIGRVTQGFGLQLAEGVIRVAIFVGYLLVVGRAEDVRRTFQYHGAEHMSIHTLEAGDPLTIEAARKYPTAHPRCGTEFLVVVVIVSILAFAFVGSQPPLILFASRVLLIPVIAAVSYELLQLGARHRNRAFVRWLWSPGIWVQAITTRQPSNDMIEVAIVSLERALIADGADLPDGSAVLACRPLNPEADEDVASAPASAA